MNAFERLAPLYTWFPTTRNQQSRIFPRAFLLSLLELDAHCPAPAFPHIMGDSVGYLFMCEISSRDFSITKAFNRRHWAFANVTRWQKKHGKAGRVTEAKRAELKKERREKKRAKRAEESGGMCRRNVFIPPRILKRVQGTRYLTSLDSSRFHLF